MMKCTEVSLEDQAISRGRFFFFKMFYFRLCVFNLFQILLPFYIQLGTVQDYSHDDDGWRQTVQN